ncbi:N-acylneuraminate cytidylyltransferase [Nitrosospira multiformis]|uniref:3-deoxy-D-manno-octulosonate 8-phosphate phosphatase KdsC n=1 Tax=Nitrosospira multiformis TaxID=1231 RepID=A0A1I0AFW8_9PROT|nr:acylneuraminate cytidylyltransferase [Nitrosospira multiformis]SES93157.1 N-acylneuraminate cytidylyltransferase [Nitrosospira multiformis]
MPLRAHSKSIIEKNVRNIAGRPLFAWSLEQAIASQCFDDIYVATDSPKIRKAVLEEFPSVTVLERSAATCMDTASTESAMLEFQQQVPFDVMCLIQATSPLTRADDFRSARHKFLTENLDSLLTAVPSKRFFWSVHGTPVNYDPLHRPRRQDFEGYLMENGAFYLTQRKLLEECGCRLGGRIGIHEMAAESGIEIDDETDWIVVEQLLLKQKRQTVNAVAAEIKALVLDVDGTLTDGGMYYGPGGEALKKFNTRDAHGMKLLRENGIRVGVITTETSPSVEARMRKLGIDEYYPGARDKFAVLLQLATRWSVSLQHIAYIGDDLCDLECMRRVGAAFCPADAVPEIMQQAHHVCGHAGGNDAVREVCDLILKARTAVLAEVSASRLAATGAMKL